MILNAKYKRIKKEFEEYVPDIILNMKQMVQLKVSSRLINCRKFALMQ